MIKICSSSSLMDIEINRWMWTHGNSSIVPTCHLLHCRKYRSEMNKLTNQSTAKSDNLFFSPLTDLFTYCILEDHLERAVEQGIPYAELYHQSHIWCPALSNQLTSLVWRGSSLSPVSCPSNPETHPGGLQDQPYARQIHLAPQSSAEVPGCHTGE